MFSIKKWFFAKCSNCEKNVLFFDKCVDCGLEECKDCRQSNTSLDLCDDCGKFVCKKCKEKHQCNVSEEENTEMEKCKNCEKETEGIECYNCNDNFCDNCIAHCEECDNDFCSECYEDNSTHDCDIGFRISIGFKNTTDELSFVFSSKQEAKSIYADFVNKWKINEKFIEYKNTITLTEEIKYIDLRL